MSSEPGDAPSRPAALGSPGLRSRHARRRVRHALPWATWALALGITAWLSLDVAGVGVSPGAAEIVEVHLTSPATVAALSLPVAAGDRIEKGQVVAMLDGSGIDLELAVATSELERIRLQVAAEAAELKDNDLVTEERLASDAERAAVALATVQSEQQRDRAELDQLDEQIARQRRLVDDKLAAQAALDELKLRRAALATKVAEYQHLVSSARAHLASSQQRIAQWRRSRHGETAVVLEEREDHEPRLSPHRAAVKAQEERVRQLLARREQLTLRSPVAARVARVHLAPGSTALAGAPVVTLVEEAPDRVIAYVEESKARHVRVGDRARLLPSDRSWPPAGGAVVAVGPGIVELPPRFRVVPTEPTYGREVYVLLDESALRPLPGQAFDVSFTRGTGAR